MSSHCHSLPTSDVAHPPPGVLLLQPIELPIHARCVLPTDHIIYLARRFQFGQNCGDQSNLRRLCAPYLPFCTVTLVKVPHHVVGGHSNLIHRSRKPSCLEPIATVSRDTRQTLSCCAAGGPTLNAPHLTPGHRRIQWSGTCRWTALLPDPPSALLRDSWSWNLASGPRSTPIFCD